MGQVRVVQMVEGGRPCTAPLTADDRVLLPVHWTSTISWYSSPNAPGRSSPACGNLHPKLASGCRAATGRDALAIGARGADGGCSRAQRAVSGGVAKPDRADGPGASSYLGLKRARATR